MPITTKVNFYPGEEWKGDIARMMMYMFLRYGEQCNLNRVGDDTNTYNSEIPDIFLEWNVEDPVSEFELQRNPILENIQGNRNPFIDNLHLLHKFGAAHKQKIALQTKSLHL